MAVRRCEGPQGDPGYQWVESGQTVVTECHTYTEGDEKAGTVAMIRAIRDGETAAGQGDAAPRIPLI